MCSIGLAVKLYSPLRKCSRLPTIAAASQGVPSWKTTFGPHRDRPFRVVRVRCDRLGEVGLDRAVDADRGERVEDRAGVDDSCGVVAGARGIEALLLGLDRECDGPARLGSRSRDAIVLGRTVARAVVRRSCHSTSTQREVRPAPPAAARPAAVAAPRARNDLRSIRSGTVPPLVRFAV